MIAYRIRLADLNRHLLEIECRVPQPAATQRLSLPSWIPGSYLLREFARHVVAIEARSQDRAVSISKLDASTWSVEGAHEALTVVIRVHALDLSVRGAYLDTQRGFFNGACVFLRPHGFEHDPVELTIERPPHAPCADWRVATAMAATQTDAMGFGRYRARDYDELIDHPFEIGEFARVDFDAAGIPHGLVVTGRHESDLERVATDLSQLCEAQLRFFGAPAPFDRYVFLGLAVDKGFGGLEHRASSSLVFEAADLPKPGEAGTPREYQRFLSLCSHEYFHAWNVKQLKPAAFSPYRLNERNYTRLLWVFEGITSYYQDLMILRSDLVGREAYLDRLAQVLTRVYRTPGRALQTLAEASFDAWDRLYKPEPGSVNTTISYYTKGALVALALDLTVRKETDSAVSLDNIMLALWHRFGRQGQGLEEGDFERVAAEVAGVPLDDFFDTAIRSTQDLPLAELLAAFGVELELRAAAGNQDLGGESTRARGERPLGLGASYKGGAAGVELTAVLDGGPAEAAGLIAGDEIVAIGGLRVDAGNLTRRLARYEPDERVEVAFFRRNELMRAQVGLALAPLDTCSLVLADGPGSRAESLRRAWLGA